MSTTRPSVLIARSIVLRLSEGGGSMRGRGQSLRRAWMGATGSASHSRPSTTGAAPRLRDFNRASLSAIRSARSANSWSSSIIGARAASTATTARHATQAVAIPIQMSIFTSSMLLLCTRMGVNALFKGTGPVGGYRCRFRSPHSLSLCPAHCRSRVYFATRTRLSQVRY